MRCRNSRTGSLGFRFTSAVHILATSEDLSPQILRLHFILSIKVDHVEEHDPHTWYVKLDNEAAMACKVRMTESRNTHIRTDQLTVYERHDQLSRSLLYAWQDQLHFVCVISQAVDQRTSNSLFQFRHLHSVTVWGSTTTICPDHAEVFLISLWPLIHGSSSPSTWMHALQSESEAHRLIGWWHKHNATDLDNHVYRVSKRLHIPVLLY